MAKLMIDNLSLLRSPVFQHAQDFITWLRRGGEENGSWSQTVWVQILALSHTLCDFGAHYLGSQCLSFLICKVEKMTLFYLHFQGCYKKLYNVCKYFHVKLSIQKSTNFSYKLAVTSDCSDKTMHAKITAMFKYYYCPQCFKIYPQILFISPPTLPEVEPNSPSFEYELYLVTHFQ